MVYFFLVFLFTTLKLWPFKHSFQNLKSEDIFSPLQINFWYHTFKFTRKKILLWFELIRPSNSLQFFIYLKKKKKKNYFTSYKDIHFHIPNSVLKPIPGTSIIKKKKNPLSDKIKKIQIIWSGLLSFPTLT